MFSCPRIAVTASHLDPQADEERQEERKCIQDYHCSYLDDKEGSDVVYLLWHMCHANQAEELVTDLHAPDLVEPLDERIEFSIYRRSMSQESEF